MKVDKRVYLALIGLLLVGVLAIYLVAINRTNKEKIEETITIVDQRGKKIGIPKNVKRIVTCTIPEPFIIYAIDGTGDRIVGMNPVSRKIIKEGILEKMDPSLKLIPTSFIEKGFSFVPNVEELLKLKPDVVFQWAWLGEGIIKPIEEAGIPVIGLNYGTQKDLEGWIRITGEVLGKENKAQELINYHHKVWNEIATRTSSIPDDKKPKVLFLPFGDKLLKVFGKKTYPDEYAELTGAINVAHELSFRQNVSLEQIIAWNPDIIYIGNFCDATPEDILSNPNWSGISAVKSKRVYKIPEGTFRWFPPCQESPLMWKWLAQIQHPDLFNYDLREDIRDFFLRFYKYRLTEKDIDKILHCDMNKDLPCCKNKGKICQKSL